MLTIYLSALENADDHEKFLKLYEQYEKKLYSIALHILKNSVQAEDAVQQTWLKILEKWDSVSLLGWSELGGYVVTIAKNASIDILRAEKNTVSFPEHWDMPARKESEDDYAYLLSLIRAMPASYRRILELKFVEEASNREIARRMDLNESTVATRISRGRMLLKERLEKEGYRYA